MLQDAEGVIIAFAVGIVCLEKVLWLGKKVAPFVGGSSNGKNGKPSESVAQNKININSGNTEKNSDERFLMFSDLDRHCLPRMELFKKQFELMNGYLEKGEARFDNIEKNLNRLNEHILDAFSGSFKRRSDKDN